MKPTDKQNELEKKFEEVHHHLGQLKDSLFIGDLVKDAAISPFAWTRIIKGCPIDDPYLIPTWGSWHDEKSPHEPTKGFPEERAVRSFMEMGRCYAAFGAAIEDLWNASLAVLKDRESNPRTYSYPPERLDEDEVPMAFDFITESIIDALGPEEKSRLLSGCGALIKGKNPPGICSTCEKALLSRLMYIKSQLHPDLLECAKRFSLEVAEFSKRAGFLSGGQSSPDNQTVIFGHASSTPFTCEDPGTTEDRIRNYPRRGAAPDLFIDACDDGLKRTILLDSMCDESCIRTALASENSGRCEIPQWLNDLQSAYQQTCKYDESLPDLVLALFRDYWSHPEHYTDDMTCDEVRGYKLEARHQIIKLLPLRLRRRLYWGFGHRPAIEGCAMLTDLEKEILRTPEYLSLEEAANGLSPAF